jgi:adenine-specific DNA-methyltransferase
MEMDDFVAYSYEQGQLTLEERETDTLKEHGQFLTPPAVARYMATKLGHIQNGASLLEPACGSGVLVCAVIERLISEKNPLELSVSAHETDKELAAISRQVFERASQKAAKHGIQLRWQVLQEDFILACLPDEQPSLFGSSQAQRKSFDFVISNPPYFKLNADDARVKAVSGKLNGHTNIYTLFMALSFKMQTSLHAQPTAA